MRPLLDRTPTPATRPGSAPRSAPGGTPGFTLVELVIVVAIVGILAAAALPLARWSVKRQKEYELQESLRILRTALDKYHDMALAGLIEAGPETNGWPPDLDVLVEGVELQSELPEIVPGVAGEYAATGLGLVGGYGGVGEEGQGPRTVGLGSAGTITVQEGRLVIQPRGGGGPVELTLGESGIGRATLGRQQGGAVGRGIFGSGTGQAAGTSFGQGRGTTFGQAGGGFGRVGRDASGRPGSDAGRPLGPDGKPLKIVFLRRLPVDPLTGEADWGLRCYSEEPDDTMWCGRNVFDVYSKARGRGINGIPYREW